MMNLQPLFEAQKKLDEHIEKSKGLEGHNLLDKKILALQVELGELANEWRGFKYWSENKEPNAKEEVVCGFCDEGVIHDGRSAPGVCGWCLGDYVESCKNPLLEEYVDCLHFILSIGNDLGMSETITVEWISEQGDYSEETTTDTFICLLQEVAGINTYHQQYVRDKYETAFLILIALGLEERHLGFTWEQIEQAYFAKNEENHQRQENGY